MKLLTKPEFLETFAHPMSRVGRDEDPPCDFWSYVDSIPQADFEEHDCSAGDVTYAWNNPAGTFQHILIDSEHPNIFMVVVIHLQTRTVFGHHLLDLNREYGIEAS